MKITSEVFQIGGSGLTSSEDAAAYLINFEGHVAIVDAGCGHSGERLLENIRTCGVKLDQVEYLLITHCHFDHTGGAEVLRKKTGCKIVAHELDAQFLEKGDSRVTAANWYGAKLHPLLIDQKITGEYEEIQLGDKIVQAIHIPGHSPGSLVYLTESDGLKVLFAQDVHGPLDSSLLSNREDYVNSLKRLLTFKADILCEGHYGVYHGIQKVEDFIRQFLSTP